MARLAKGVPTTGSAVLPSHNATVFLISEECKLKVAAQCVKLKDNRTKITPIGPKLAIPESYPGWFEILSEDGRAARVIDSVAELARRCPDSCILRESMRVFVGKGDGTEALTDKSKILPAGEMLVIVGEVVSNDRRFATPTTPTSAIQSSTKGRFLRCFEQNGESVFLSLDHKGRFSPVAREDSVSGVHNIRQLIRKRFPLMVRLVHGPPPLNGKNFLPEMRLYACFEEESLMALPLTTKDNSSIIAVPLNAPIKFQGPSNADDVTALPEHTRLLKKCREMLNESEDKIQVFDIKLDKDILTKQRFPPIRQSISDHSGKEECIDVKEQPGSPPSISTTPSLIDTRYDEIDQIYDYVRGFAPLPKTVRHELNSANCPPTPPPIESIPVRRHSVPSQPIRHMYEKLQRKISTDFSRNNTPSASNKQPRFTKIVSKGRHSQRMRFLFRHSPKTNIVPHAASSATPKNSNHYPLFNIRYKSLTSLAIADGTATVNSSNSAGSESSSPNEKCSHPRLSRPRSLNNLLWDIQHEEVPDIPTSTKRLGTLYL